MGYLTSVIMVSLVLISLPSVVITSSQVWTQPNKEPTSLKSDTIPQESEDTLDPLDKYSVYRKGDLSKTDLYRLKGVNVTHSSSKMAIVETTPSHSVTPESGHLSTFGDILKIVGDLDGDPKKGNQDESARIGHINDILGAVAFIAPKLEEVLRQATHQPPGLVEDKDGRKPLFEYTKILVDRNRKSAQVIREMIGQAVLHISGIENIIDEHNMTVSYLKEVIFAELPSVGDILKALGDRVPNGQRPIQMGVENVQKLPQMINDLMNKTAIISKSVDLKGIKDELVEEVDNLQSGFLQSLMNKIMNDIRATLNMPHLATDVTYSKLNTGTEEITDIEKLFEADSISKSKSSTSPFHVFEKGSCSAKWVRVLTSNGYGAIVFGSKRLLQAAILQGSRVRFEADLPVDPGYSSELDNCQLVNKDVCCQNLMHISKTGWELFQRRAYWWMNSICTTGNWQMVRYFVGGNYKSQTKIYVTVSWFVTRPLKGKPRKPILSTSWTGRVVSGSAKALVKAVRKGHTIRAVTARRLLYPIQNVQLFPGPRGAERVSGESIWRVSQAVTGDRIEITDDAFWTFNMLTSGGSLSVSGWTLGNHVSRQQTTRVIALDWFVDSCWKKSFKSDEGGKKGRSNLRKLRREVESGHSVKMQIGNTIIEAESVRISNDVLSAQSVSSLARKNRIKYADDLFWQFRVVSTKGTVRTYRPLVGDPALSSLGNTVEQTSVTWFVDTRTWIPILHTDVSGNVISGSKLKVRLAVKLGADLRLGLKKSGDPGFQYIRVDNAEFSPRGSNNLDTAVQLIRLLWEVPVGSDEFQLESSPSWSFQSVNTRGDLRTTRWTVGENVNLARTTEKVEVRWFACF